MDLQLGLFDGTDTPGVSPVGPALVPPDLVAAAERLPAGLRLGTSSWSFPGWTGLVYDRTASEITLARHGLTAYAQHPVLRTVGIDRTYYRPIPAAEFRTYADEVPDDFRFLVKADRLLTSPLDPGGTSLRGPNPLFLDATYAIEEVIGPMVEGLGAKVGTLLFQFPPMSANLVGGRAAFAERLHGFLDALPPGTVYSVELRTPALLTAAYAAVLDTTRTAHCFTVHPAMAPLEEQVRVVRHYEQPMLVVRWMLHAGLKYDVAKRRYAPFDRIQDEDPDSLERIAVMALDALIAERDVLVVANNKAEGSAPLSIFRLAQRMAAWEQRPLEIGHPLSHPPSPEKSPTR